MKTLKGIYNTVTGGYEDIEVTEDVYVAYMRTGWNISDSNKSFYLHEIQMSALIGGNDEGYENFREFISNDADPADIVVSKMEKESLIRATGTLTAEELDLIKALFCEDKTEREYSVAKGIAQKTINNRKMVILKKIKKILETQK